jgi:hypothetical protein
LTKIKSNIKVGFLERGRKKKFLAILNLLKIAATIFWRKILKDSSAENLRQRQLIVMTTGKDAFKMKKVLEIPNHCPAVKFKWNLHWQCSLQSTS